MKGELKAVLVSNTVHIDTARIPRHVGHNLAQVALRAIQRDFQDPAIRADYERWKQERTAQAAGGRADG